MEETYYVITVDYDTDNPYMGSSFYFEKSELLENIDFFLSHREQIEIRKFEPVENKQQE